MILLHKFIPTTIFFFLLFQIPSIHGQRIINTISNDICTCVGKIDLTKDTSAINQEVIICIVNSMKNNSKEIKKELDIDMSTEEGTGKIDSLVMPILLKSCDNVFKALNVCNKGLKCIQESEVTITNCMEYQFGKFKILKSRSDTSRYIIRDKHSIKEYDGAGNLLLASKIKWVNDCEYIETIEEVNVEDLKSLFSVGSKMRVRMISSEGNVVKMQRFFRGVYFRMKYKKVE